MSLEKAKLSSGLTVYNDHVEGAKTNHVSMFIPYGSVDEQPGHEGAAHVLEHCVHLETDDFASKAEMMRWAANQGMVRNASTYYTRTLYYANGLELEPNIRLLHQILQRTHLPADKIPHELTAVRREMTTKLDDINSLHLVAATNGMFGTPFGRRVGGHEDKIDFDPDTVQDIFDRNYAVNAMALVVTGAAELDDVALLAERYFAPSTSGAAPDRCVTPPNLGEAHRTALLRDTSNARVAVGYPMSAEFRDDYQQNQLAYTLALRAMSRACFERMRYDEGLSYDGSVSSVIYNHPDAWRIGGFVTVDPQDIPRAEAVFDEIFAKSGHDYAIEQIEASINTLRYSWADSITNQSFRNNWIVDWLESYEVPQDMGAVVRKLSQVSINDVSDAIDRIVEYVAVTPRYTHITGASDAVKSAERIIELDEIA